jgi:hypothetical protein
MPEGHVNIFTGKDTFLNRFWQGAMWQSLEVVQ